MNICPNLNNEQIREEFNELISIFGEDGAYYLWDKTNGEGLLNDTFNDAMKISGDREYSITISSLEVIHKNRGDFMKAPNGADTNLTKMQWLQVRTPQFKEQFGDWEKINQFDTNNIDTSFIAVDENGEPIVTKEMLQQLFNSFMSTEKKSSTVLLDGVVSIDNDKCDINELFGENLVGKMLSEELATSDQILQIMLNKNVFGIYDEGLAKIMSIHKIRIIIDYNLGNDKLAATITDEEGNSVIAINPNAMSKVTNGYAAITILHEIVHSLTHNALTNPKTNEDKQFSKNTKSAFKSFKKIYKKYKQSFQSLWYSFENEREFVATFVTDRSVRQALKNLAIKEDRANKSTLKQTFKDFVNALSDLLLNRKLFLNNLDKYNNLQKELFEYVYNKPKTSTNLSSKLNNIIDLYRQSNGGAFVNECALDRFEDMARRQKYIISHNIDSTRQDVAEMFRIRIKALSASANSQIKDRQRLLLDTKNYEAMFSNLDDDINTVLMSFLKSSASQLLNDFHEIEALYKSGKELSSEEYIYHTHSNFEMYNQIGASIRVMLNDVNNANRFDTEQKSEIIRYVDSLNTVCAHGISILNIMLNKISAKTLKAVEKETDAPDLGEVIKKMEDGEIVVSEDVGKFWMYIGTMDASSNPILKSIAYILNNAKNAAEEESLKSIVPLIKLSNGLDVTKLYEKYNNRFTGYLIRKYNYGKFNYEYETFIKELNKDIAKKYNITIKPGQKFAPQDNDQARIEWHLRRNEWLDKHAERKHTKKYYDAYAKLPDFVRAAVNSIDREIYALLNKTEYIQTEVDDNGKEYTRVVYEKITKKDWDSYLKLKAQKKSLSSFYDIHGNPKLEGTVEYDIAKALKELNEQLDESGQAQRTKRVNAWKKARNAVIEQCGGMDKYLEYSKDTEEYVSKHKDDPDAFDYKTFEFWESRNTIHVFKKNQETDKKAIVFEKIEQELAGLHIDYGEEYEQNKEEMQNILKPFKDQDGEVILDLLPSKIKKRLYQLQKRQFDIQKKAAKNNRIIAQTQKKIASVYKKYITSKDTKYYRDAKRKVLQNLSEDTFDLDEYYYGLSEYGQIYFDYISGAVQGIMPYKWTQKSVAVNDAYMEIQPGDAWINTDNQTHINPNFDEEENESIIPKKELYLNQEYDKIMKDEKYKKLYKAVVDYLHTCNKKQTNRHYTNDYLLPQMQGTLMQRIHNEPNYLTKASKFFQWLKQKFGIGSDENDSGNVGDTYIESSSAEQGGYFEKHENSSRGRYPDGTPFYILPQYYTSKLEDPSTISSDLINILYNYYLMSASYEQKSKVRGDLEALLAKLRGRTVTKESNAYNQASKFLEMNLYNVKRSPLSWVSKQFHIKGDVAKTLELWKEYSTAKNLGLNPKVAIVGGLTSFFCHTVRAIANSLPGVYGNYNMVNGMRAFTEVLYKLLTRGMSYISNPDSNDKVMAIMEYCDLANQGGERKTKYMNRNILSRTASRNYTYGILALTDFFAKSNFAVSVFMSHRFVDGEFLTKMDIYNRRIQYGEEKFKRLLKEYKNAKSLYSVLQSRDGYLGVQDEYLSAWEKSKNIIKNRAVKLSESYDGMATTLQKNILTQNIIGALVLMHRQFLTLQLQEGFAKASYDYDMREYKNGQFREMFDMLFQLAKENALLGYAGLSLMGLAFGGPIGMTVIPGGVAMYNIISAIRKRYFGVQEVEEKEKKSTKDILKDYFNDTSSQKDYTKSLYNRQTAALTLVEIVMISFMLEPLITSFCISHDDDDSWIIQFILYCLRCFAWEAGTKYKTAELFNNIKSATAATSTTDAFMEVSQNLQVMSGGSKYNNPLFDLGQLISSFIDNERGLSEEEGYDDIIESGAYEGRTKRERAFFKFLPVHNVYEQVMDPKSKRKYQEIQIQKLPETQR